MSAQSPESGLDDGERRPPIVYFGNDWFAENRTSSHQIARRLARTHRVYYIECPGLRAPKSTGRDFKKVWNKLRRFFQGSRAGGDGLEVRTLLQIPLHRFAFVRRLNQILIVWTLRWWMWRAGVQRPILWFMVPHLSSVVGRLGERLSVYYCIDDYARLPDVDAAAVGAMDEELTRKAGLVFVASATLLEAKLRLNPNTHVSPHGVDFDHFASAQDEQTKLPESLEEIPRPVMGFFGLIERWIDLDLIDYLAEQRPHWSFVLIGRVAVGEKELPKCSNVYLLGKRPYESLASYGKGFDVALIPYRLTHQVLHANPIKLREYLAMGKPVVSVSTPEIDKYADVVEIARSREEFLAKLDEVVARGDSPDEIRRRMDRVASESWEARIREVYAIVSRRLHEIDPAYGDLTLADERVVHGEPRQAGHR